MISLNFRDPRPIYEQLQDQLRRLILNGALETQEKLPSVRELSSELAINPNTIQRAYRGLEAQGFIYTIAGKGSFVAALEEVDQGRIQELKEKFISTATELLQLGTSQAQLVQMIEEANAHD